MPSFSMTQILNQVLSGGAIVGDLSATQVLNVIFNQTAKALNIKIAGYSLDEVSDPTVDDDLGNGFPIGSIWINTVGKEAFISVDPTNGAAVWKSITSGAGGGSIALRNWKFSTNTAEADPGSKTFRINSGTPASATEMYISHVHNSGGDASDLFLSLEAGDKIYVRELDVAANNSYYDIVSVENKGGWSKIIFTIEDSGTLFANDSDCGFIFDYASNISGGAISVSIKDFSVTSPASWTAAEADVISKPRKFKNMLRVERDISLGQGDESAGTIQGSISFIAKTIFEDHRPKITDNKYLMTVGDADVDWDGLDYFMHADNNDVFFEGAPLSSQRYRIRNGDISRAADFAFIRMVNDTYGSITLDNATGTDTATSFGKIHLKQNSSGGQKAITDLKIINGCNLSGLLASANGTVAELNVYISGGSVIKNNGQGVWNATGGAVIKVFYTADSKVDETLVSGSSAIVFTLLDKIPGNQIDPWGVVGKSKYTPTPDSTSRILMSDTSDREVGELLRFTDSGGPFYARISAISSDVHIDIEGAALDTGDDIILLEVRPAVDATLLYLFVGGTYGDGTEDNLLRVDQKSPFQWTGGKHFCVFFKMSQSSIDTGTEAKVNLEIDNAAVSTNDTNLGIQLGAADTFIKNSAVAINLSNYEVNDGDEVELATKAAGGTGDASDLTAIAVFIPEK